MTLAKTENRQRRFDVDTDMCRSLLSEFIRYSRRIRSGDSTPWVEVMVLLVDDKASAAAHSAAFEDPTPTDVITMSYAPMPGIGTGISGELVVNVCRAEELGRKHARGNRWSPDHELALYIAHGIDHLAGGTDEQPEARLKMRRRDLAWVHRADAAGLVRGLFRSDRTTEI